MLFTGSGVAIVTPFYEDGSIDYSALKNLIEFHIDNETDAIIIAGTTGETATLSDEEQLEIIRFTVKEVNQRIPVIAGTGSNNTQHSLYLSQEAEKMGVDGLLIVTPYYNKATQKGLIAHYQTIHDQTSTPILLYNVPGRTNVNIEPETVYELSKMERIVGLKEASGDFSQILKIRRLCDDDFALYSGNDDQIVPFLALGGVGVISVLANILPKETHRMVEHYLEGNVIQAERMQTHYQALIDHLFIEPSPTAVKYVLAEMGYIDNVLRLPLLPLEETNVEIMNQLLEEYQIK
ncbi:4-hydroxy-tetrahydrodipicolinate synthase [Erysipelothrix urinaevulpis]|uniref:4-hydroxy-tetrahydrodipicolinate synthase n=1 Tax=Erysipelothrix urinaevulpis TaxID=2683717 RepID=UPI001357E3A8|nr:4-hydroxy-tetrahydrodipicolinate synthase [Erysipelothrix urinaevulpis]